MQILFIIAVICFIYNSLRFVTKSGRKNRMLENCFFAVAWTFVAMAVNATFLTIAGKYSLNKVAALMLLESVASLAVYRGNLTIYKSLINGCKTISLYKALAGIVCAAILYFGFPTMYLWGGRDPGLYFIDAVHISQTGTMQYEADSYINDHYDDIKDIVDLGYPGLYSAYEYHLSDEPGKIIAQFLPVFPACLAIGYDLAGMDGLIRVNAVIALLCLWVIFFFVEKVFNRETAKMVFLLLLVNPAQLWNARITQSELLCQFLFFMSMYSLEAGWESRDKRTALLAGALLSFSTLCRIDMYILGVGLLVFAIYMIICNPVEKGYVLNVTGMYIVGGVLSLVYGYIFSYPYYYEHWKMGALSSVVLCNTALLGVILTLLVIQKFGGFFRMFSRPFIAICNSRAAMLIFCGGLFVIFLFAFLIRPELMPGDFAHNAMVEFCYYTTPLAVCLAIAGIYFTFFGRGRERERELAYFLISGISLVIYIWKPSITPDHVWACRRWVTVAIPFVVILSSFALSKMFRNLKYRWIIRFGLIGVIFCYFIWQDRGFLITKIFEGVNKDYQELAVELKDEEVYFTMNQEIASVFRYVYNKNVYLLNRDMQALTEYLEDHEKFLFLGDENDIKSFEVEQILCSEGSISGEMLTELYGKIPDTLYEKKYVCNVMEIKKRSAGDEIVLDMNILFASDISTLEKDSYISNGNSGFLFYGPYCTLMPGSYELRVGLEAEDGLDVGVEITSDEGRNVIKSQEVIDNGVSVISFDIEEYTEAVEFRAYILNNSITCCNYVSITKVGEANSLDKIYNN